MHAKSQQCAAGKFFAVLIFFLSRRTEVPQCSVQARFDGEREERGNTEKEGKETGQERGKTRADLRQDKEESEREEGTGVNAVNEQKKRDAFFCGRPLCFSLAFRLFFNFFFYLSNPILI